jgi:hypothetical protein
VGEKMSLKIVGSYRNNIGNSFLFLDYCFDLIVHSLLSNDVPEWRVGILEEFADESK